MPKKLKIRGKWWDYEEALLTDRDGDCDPPDKKKKRIRVRTGTRNCPWLYAETALHEMLHAALWDLGEEAVDEISRDLVHNLKRLGVQVSLERDA